MLHSFGHLSVQGSTITGNEVGKSGGGIWSFDWGTVVIDPLFSITGDIPDDCPFTDAG